MAGRGTLVPNDFFHHDAYLFFTYIRMNPNIIYDKIYDIDKKRKICVFPDQRY